ncbi:molybdopterin-dependent oxidoreductase [Nocardia asteroides]|uniref:molybdopterin-dependent oxidoreductase n=1 Tax=Nocardia asteroides TaxID=1824 RepID=UPI001E475435|nr:molybdopterin-dependent oxidoreductase [Nocardia asteroides]UGT61078.1 molybdopterin-dependent oxidoreductase [Nocardia asteroides]
MPEPRLTATHWGNYLVGAAPDGTIAVRPAAGDPEPSPIGRSLAAARDPGVRIARPAVRRGYLRDRDRSGRGREPFVEVEWDEAIDLAAGALRDTIAAHGNRAIYGGSYGWASAGRFHHAQGQLHRFLRLAGGYTDSVDTYSFAAAEVIVPHIIGLNAYYAGKQAPTTAEVAEHCRCLVLFGGAPSRNTQVNPGGIGAHDDRGHLAELSAAGVEIVHVGPLRDDVDAAVGARWLPCRPNADVPVLLALVHTVLAENLQDDDFLARYTVGFDEFARYVRGGDGVPKTPEWAAELSGVPAAEIRVLARKLAAGRSLIGLSYAVQRARYGEQPYWAAWALAAALGYIGLPGGGVQMGSGVGKGTTLQRRVPPFRIGTIPQGPNPVADTVPVSRIAELLERPGEPYRYNGADRVYPEIDLVYWAGGNPFHHHQDLNRLRRAWTRPGTVIVNEHSWTATARHADIVFPVTTALEREDFAGSSSDHWLTPMHRVFEPYGAARDDHAVLAALAGRLGFGAAFTEGRSTAEWVEHVWETTRSDAAAAGVELPAYREFRVGPPLDLRPLLPEREHDLERFRADPVRHPLRTPSGRIEIYSHAIAEAGDLLGHPAWYPDREWLGDPRAERFPLHLLSNQPATRLHSQLDNGATSRDAKIAEREPLRLHPADAAARGLRDGDLARVFNDRGAFLAGVATSDALLPGVAQIATGAWYDPDDELGLERHGNPNVVTPDIGTSPLAQGPSPNSCLVQVEKFDGAPPPVRAFEPPEFGSR